jgi:hypothetical protein
MNFLSPLYSLFIFVHTRVEGEVCLECASHGNWVCFPSSYEGWTCCGCSGTHCSACPHEEDCIFDFYAPSHFACKPSHLSVGIITAIVIGGSSFRLQFYCDCFLAFLSPVLMTRASWYSALCFVGAIVGFSIYFVNKRRRQSEQGYTYSSMPPNTAYPGGYDPQAGYQSSAYDN